MATTIWFEMNEKRVRAHKYRKVLKAAFILIKAKKKSIFSSFL